MKLFVVILLTGYFLARDNEGLQPAGENLKRLLKSWAVYLLCAGLSAFAGLLLNKPGQGLNPLILFLAAALPAIIFRGRPVCMIAGAATAFCALRFIADGSYVAAALMSVEIGALIVAFLYQGARVRMAQLYLPLLTQKASGRLFVLFSLAVLTALVYQKAVQLF